MPKKPPQFFTEKKAGPSSARLPRTGIAVYEIPGINGKNVRVAVQCMENGGNNNPQNAATVAELVCDTLTEELDAITALAKLTIDNLASLKPGEIKIEFGVELGGELKVPFVTKGDARANFKITLKWKNNEPSSGNDKSK